MSPEALKEKLFTITCKKRKIHDYSQVIRPLVCTPLAKERLFRTDNNRRRVLELGSGWGEFLCQWLRHFPQDDYVAFEIKQDRIEKTIRKLSKLEDEPHLRILPVNFNYFLEELLPPQVFDLVIINFPDPWPKKRHWKHRLIRNGFDQRIKSILRPKAKLYLSSDHGPYSRKILSLFRKSPHFHSMYPWPHYLRKRPENLSPTRFEEIFMDAGRRPYYQCWQLND